MGKAPSTVIYINKMKNNYIFKDNFKNIIILVPKVGFQYQNSPEYIDVLLTITNLIPILPGVDINHFGNSWCKGIQT